MLKTSTEFTDLGIETFMAYKDSKKEAYTEEDIDAIKGYGGMGKQAIKFSKEEGIPLHPYTPPYVVDLMWQLARHHGYKNGSIFEPSAGTGRVLEPLQAKHRCVGFEPNPMAFRIAQLSCPRATLYNHHFETAFLNYPRFTGKLRDRLTWLSEYPFSLAIGSPPFGAFKSRYKSFFPEAKALIQMEIFFMYKCLQLLRSGGLLVFLVDGNFLRNGDTLNMAKTELSKLCDFLDAYRLPDVYPDSHLLTDIIILKRK